MPADRPKSTLPILFSIVIVDLIGFGIVLPILPFYADAYGASATVLGLLLTCYAAMQFVFAPIWGRLSDRVGRRPVMLVTIAGTGAALLLLGLADSLIWLFIARILGGIFGANISVATAYLSDVTEEGERTRWMGMIGASFGVGFLLGPAIGGLLSPYGYGVPMLAAAGMATVNFVYACFVLKEPARHLPRESDVPRPREVLADPAVRRLCTINFIFTFAVCQLETTFAYLMKDRFSYDAMQVAFILVFMAFITMSIQGGAIRGLARRFGEKTLLVAGVAFMSSAFFAIPWMYRVTLLLLPLGLSAVGRAISQPSLMSMVSLRATSVTRGAVMGGFQSASALARVFGPLAAGALYDYQMGAPYLLAGLLMAVAFIASSVLPASETSAKAVPV
ncbi:MAG: MFS transporter [Deltaproteobacteria bacterium]|nr:MFS transporter [Deltaproteobacteria bacterium]MBW2417464.1 MFS transporter [Deltaproteobacteria bacterium]